MGYSLQIDKQDPVSLASNQGLADFHAWVSTLSAAESATLRHLCQYGWTGKVSALKTELAAAVKAHPPKREDVKGTAAQLLQSLGNGKAQVVSITDGLGGGRDVGQDDQNDA